MRHHLEALQRLAYPRLAMNQQGAGGVNCRHARPHHRAPGNSWHQPQRGRRDDAQRAFRSDQHLLQVEAAIVLFQRGEGGKNTAIGQHRLQPQNLCAHRPVAQHLRAAGIGADEAPDRRHALAAQREGKAQARRRCRLVQIMQHHACAAGDLAGILIHRANGLQPPQRDQQRCAAGIGRGPARHGAVAPLRHDRHAVFGAELHQRRHFRRAARRRQCQRRAGVAAAPVRQPGGG